MNAKINLLIMVVMVLAASCKTEITSTEANDPLPASNEGLTQYVNPLIGTAPLTDPEFIGYTPPEGWRVWAGLVYPGVSLPNAMVQLSPVTEYGTGAGYEYEDTVIHAFAHTNKGHWNYVNIPVLPLSGAVDPGKPGSHFSHDKETAQAGFYQVYLDDYGVDVKLTSTLRSGYHQYQYTNPEGRKILFDLAKANNRVSDWKIEKDGNSAVRGFQRNGNQVIHFYARLNEELERLEIEQEGQRNGYAVLHLANGKTNPVEMKIGLSFVSGENAKQNLDAEVGEKSFDQVKAEAVERWEDLLSNIQVEGGTQKQKELFYTSLYRAFLWPALRSDVNGEFKDVKGAVVKADYQHYTIPSLWDTYRNKLVLLGNISPKVTGDVIRSLQDIGEKTGFIPTFFHGDHAAPFIAGSYARGIEGYDVNKVYQLLLNNANKEEEGGTRPHIREYIEKGYISEPHIDSPHVETKAKAGVSKTLEYAYDDYSLAQLAKALNDTENYRVLMARAKNYQNVFDTTTNFMRGRLEDGSWVKNFNPQYPYYEYMYREANAWQVSFFAPHDMEGLIALYGGNNAFEAKLDSLFTVPWNPNYIARNVSSFIGQYVHGNQPNHEAPFSYHFIGKPEKSQQVIDNILENYYGVGEHGLALSGMDDAGEMSSWYVFSAMGLYPFSPADPEYIVTVPIFDQVRWKLQNGKELIINKSGPGRDMQYVEVNDERVDGYFVSHDLFKNGGSIDVVTK
ncbi:GH92 family glycosyl hydrolase [Cesiribacter sp. SM1]|uniref:GH92 family glycosyl hydrolase n=1 Tax=Cesiribacter sp. SM1 TaxID=2861196 RepID=UPI001CD59D55|nr:GH92 family glycosyl hydrolase [Cesiribacter sp. SM1]